MGLLWLSTVPLTNGTVATLFGVRNLSMLGGIVFLFHQLGAFLGGWLGGVVYDRTGSYDLVWQISILLSLLAAALNWPVRERRLRACRHRPHEPLPGPRVAGLWRAGAAGAGVVGMAQGWDGIDTTGHECLLGATLQAQGLSSRRNESCVLIG